jgi:hypothetical protein
VWGSKQTSSCVLSLHGSDFRKTLAHNDASSSKLGWDELSGQQLMFRLIHFLLRKAYPFYELARTDDLESMLIFRRMSLNMEVISWD